MREQNELAENAIKSIAKVCHQANKAYCESIGDPSQKDWDDAPEWQRGSAIAGVKFKLNNPDAGPDAMHNSWMKEKEADGWTYGQVKDADAKIHPCMLPYEELPMQQRRKDYLFSAIVTALFRF